MAIPPPHPHTTAPSKTKFDSGAMAMRLGNWVCTLGRALVLSKLKSTLPTPTRSRSDVAKKAAQLPVMAGKARFLNGLFEMLRCADDGAFVDDDALVGLILDSEILSSALQHLSVPEITAELLRFPGLVAHDMVSQALLHEESMLPVTIKDKTRLRGDATKVSFHFLLHICAPKAHQRMVVELLTRDRKDEIDRGATHMKANKSLPEDCGLPIAWYAFDRKACISNGFSAPFSLKDRKDPHSAKHSDRVYCLGQLVHEAPCPIRVQDLHGATLTDAERLWLLQEQLYTTPKPVMLSYAIDFGGAIGEAKVGFLYLFIPP